MTLTNTSQFADSFVWDYGDNLTSTVATLTHTHFYSAPGVYTVTLSAAHQYAARTLTHTQVITVFAQPTPAFSAVPALGAVPLTVQFHNTSTNADGFSWSFGDGSTSTAVNPTHVYATTGEYTVSLIASNPFHIGDDFSAECHHRLLSTDDGFQRHAHHRHGTAGGDLHPIVFSRDSILVGLWRWHDQQHDESHPSAYFYRAGGIHHQRDGRQRFYQHHDDQASYILVYSPSLPIDYYVDAVMGSNVAGDS